MNRIKYFAALTLMLTAAILFTGPAAVAGTIEDVIVLSPGEQVERNFHLRDVYNIDRLGPSKTFVILSTGGDNATLEIGLEAEPIDMTFGAVMSFGFRGISTAGGPGYIYETAETPFSAAVELEVGGGSSLSLVSAFIAGYEGDVDLPAECKFAFSLTDPEGHEGAEDDHEDGEDDHGEEGEDGHNHE